MKVRAETFTVETSRPHLANERQQMKIMFALIALLGINTFIETIITRSELANPIAVIVAIAIIWEVTKISRKLSNR